MTLPLMIAIILGVHSVAYAFPQVKIVTTAVDKEVNECFHIMPGIGLYPINYISEYIKIVSKMTIVLH